MQTMQNIAKQIYPGSVTFTTLGQETRWAYSTTLSSQHETITRQKFLHTSVCSVCPSCVYSVIFLTNVTNDMDPCGVRQ